MSLARLFTPNDGVENYSNISDVNYDGKTLSFNAKYHPDDTSSIKVVTNLPFIIDE